VKNGRIGSRESNSWQQTREKRSKKLAKMQLKLEYRFRRTRRPNPAQSVISSLLSNLKLFQVFQVQSGEMLSIKFGFFKA